MARKKNRDGSRKKSNGGADAATVPVTAAAAAAAVVSSNDDVVSGSSSDDAAASAVKPPMSTPSSSLPVSPSSASSDTAANAANELSASSFPDVDADKPSQDSAEVATEAAATGAAVVESPPRLHAVVVVNEPTAQQAAKPSGCCSSTSKPSASGDSCCSGKPKQLASPATNGDSTAETNAQAVVVPTAAAPSSSSSCCSSKKPAADAAEASATTSCCSSSSGSATAKPKEKPSTGGCCSSKVPAVKQGSCGASDDVKSEALTSNGCGSAAKKVAARDSCCSSKTEAPASTGCGGGAETKTTTGGSCCSSKTEAPASTGCGGGAETKATTGGSCCASTGSSARLARQPSNSHPDRVRERLFDRMAEFKNERGASMAPPGAAAKLKSVAGQSKPADVATLRLSIGGMTCSGCCTRIESFMARRSGVLGVNVSLLTSRGVFEYDPKVISAKAVEDLVGSLGFTAGVLPDESLVSIVLHVGYESPVRVRALLLDMTGVVAAEETTDGAAIAASPASSLPKAVGAQRAVVVDYDPELTGARQLVRQLSRALGFQVYASSPRPLAVQTEEADVAKFRCYLFVSCALALPIVMMEYVLPLVTVGGANPANRDIVMGLSYKDAIGFACATPILLFVAYPIHESAFLALRYGARVTMDVLISLSSFTAYAFSVVTVALAVFGTGTERSETFFEVTALLVTLILVGRYIEKIVKAKASHSVDALLRIQAKTAILLERDSESALKESYIDVILVERDDLLRVLPGTRIPTDGVVVEGASSVDESMVTGEARKVPKAVGSAVIGGTINAHGVLVMRVTHTLTESMLARIVSLVDEAQASKCVSQTLADVVAAYFTTFIIAISVIMFVVWYHLAATGAVATHGWAPLPFALRFAITVLVISCPCAISLAVPTAIMVATTIGSQFGVLFKGGQAIEALESVDVVMFDKTGTLTTGRLAVVDAVLAASTAGDVHVRQLWSLVGAAEANSEHAIGRALVAHARQLHAPELAGGATAFAAVPGCGVQAHVTGTRVCIGSFKWMHDVLKVAVPEDLRAANSRLQLRGCVVVCVAVEHDVVAVVALRDAPRPEAKRVIEQLRRQKVQTWIVTGDQRETALAVAEMLGVPEFTVIADALPHQKVDKVRLLQSIGKNVAFVGDGVNDGPALAMANVGIAVGAGSDVALESADLVLVKDDLRDLLNAIDLSRATNRMIKWNFTWGFAYNVLMMPLACGALYPFFGIAIPPALAGLSELLSSVPVILFSLLLNWWRPPYASAEGGAGDDDNDAAAHVVIQVDTRAPRETTPLLGTK